MRSTIHADDPPFGAPYPRPRPRNLMLMPPPARRPVDLDDQDPQPDEHEGRSFNQALANIEREVGHHSLAEVNSLIQANALPVAQESEDVHQVADDLAGMVIEATLRSHTLTIADGDGTLARYEAEGVRLRDAWEQLKARHQQEIAELTQQMNAHNRRQAVLRQDFERQHVRMLPKRPSSKRA